MKRRICLLIKFWCVASICNLLGAIAIIVTSSSKYVWLSNLFALKMECTTRFELIAYSEEVFLFTSKLDAIALRFLNVFYTYTIYWKHIVRQSLKVKVHGFSETRFYPAKAISQILKRARAQFYLTTITSDYNHTKKMSFTRGTLRQLYSKVLSREYSSDYKNFLDSSSRRNIAQNYFSPLAQCENKSTHNTGRNFSLYNTLIPISRRTYNPRFPYEF